MSVLCVDHVALPVLVRKGPGAFLVRAVAVYAYVLHLAPGAELAALVLEDVRHHADTTTALFGIGNAERAAVTLSSRVSHPPVPRCEASRWSVGAAAPSIVNSSIPFLVLTCLIGSWLTPSLPSPAAILLDGVEGMLGIARVQLPLTRGSLPGPAATFLDGVEGLLGNARVQLSLDRGR